MPASPMVWAALCGALAAGFSYFAGLARWWLSIQLLFVPALLLALSLKISPYWYLLLFLIFLAVYWNTFRTQVPFYLSSRKVWQALETLLPPAVPNQTFKFVDLGSGTGGVLTHLAAVRADGRFQGIEAAPLPFALSWLRIFISAYRDRCEVHWGSLWHCDLAQCDVVFAYLSPVPMQQLWQKAQREMRPGSLFISNTFAVSDHPPQHTITVDDRHQSTLYIWQM